MESIKQNITMKRISTMVDFTYISRTITKSIGVKKRLYNKALKQRNTSKMRCVKPMYWLHREGWIWWAFLSKRFRIYARAHGRNSIDYSQREDTKEIAKKWHRSWAGSVTKCLQSQAQRLCLKMLLLASQHSWNYHHNQCDGDTAAATEK